MSRSVYYWIALICAVICVPLFCVCASALTEIDALYLTGDIDVSAGKAPVALTAPSDAFYSVSSAWDEYDSDTGETLPAEGSFELGRTYYLSITVTAHEGYCFPMGGVPLYINGGYVDTIEYTEGALSYMMAFDTDDYVRCVSITGVPEVKEGNTADLGSLGADLPFCTVSGEFFVFDTAEGGYVPFSGQFARGYEYRLSLRIEFESGYYPSPDAFTVCVLGTEYYDVEHDGGAVLCSIRYSLSSVIEIVELWGITLPVAGEDASSPVPVTPSGVRYYSEHAGWSTYDGSSYVEVSSFDHGKTYSLDITLRAEAGYEFADTVILYLNGERLDDRNGSGEYLYIYEEYKTDALISSLRFKADSIKDGASASSFKVIPFLTASPKYTLSFELTEHVIGEGSYVMSTELFHAAGIYELRITARAKEGYCFSESTKVYEAMSAVTPESISRSEITLCFYRPLAKTLDSIFLTGVIPPEGGRLPRTDSVSAEGSGYTLTKAEYLELDPVSGELHAVEGCFKAGRTYALRAEVLCEFGWAFIGSDTVFYIGGEQCTATEAGYTSAEGYVYFTAGAGECAGDTDHDGVLTISDITLLVRYLAGWQTGIFAECADTDKNGRVNNRDVITLVKYLTESTGE